MRRFRFTITSRSGQFHTVTVIAANETEARTMARQEFRGLGFSDEGGSDTLGRIGSLSNVQDLGAPPAVADPTGITQPGIAQTPPSPIGDIASAEEQASFGAFQSALRARGIAPEGIQGQFARGQFAPAQRAFGLGQQFGAVPQGTFSDFISQGGQLGTTSRNILQDVFNRALGGGLNPAQQDLANPQFFGASGAEPFRFGAGAENLTAAARADLAQRTSPFTARFFGPQQATIERRAEEQAFNALTQGDQFQFAPFLARQFGR